jgi:hypothetical protein
MLLMQIFLPRFLVLEVVLFFHFIQQGHCQEQSDDGENEVRKNVLAGNGFSGLAC